MATPMTFSHQLACDTMAYQAAFLSKVFGAAQLNAKGHVGLEYYLVIGVANPQLTDLVFDTVYAKDAIAAIANVKHGFNSADAVTVTQPRQWLAWPRSQIQIIGQADFPGRNERGGYDHDYAWLGFNGSVHPPYIVLGYDIDAALECLINHTGNSNAYLACPITKIWGGRSLFNAFLK